MNENHFADATGPPDEIDAEFEHELGELFQRTAPSIPPFDSAAIPSQRSVFGRVPMFVRIAVPVTAAVILLSLAIFWSPDRAGANFSFAEVQKEIEQTKTLRYRQRTVTNSEDEPKEKTKTETVSLQAPGMFRHDFENGSYSLLDLPNAKTMSVDPENKRVTIFEGVGTITPEMQQMNLYELIRDLSSESVGELPAKQIGGKDCPGFLVIRKINSPYFDDELQTEIRLWVNPESKLPILMEQRMFTGEDEPDESTVIISDQFAFGVPLKESLFSFEPPAGYEVQQFGTAKLAPALDDEQKQKPVLTPKVGLGPVKFGMLLDDVKKALGEPDQSIPVGNKAVSLNYNSRGYGLQVSDVLGVMTINVTSQRLFATRIRDFEGKTDKGIGLGASEAEVIKAYGEPSRIDDDEQDGGLKTLYYDDLNGWFSFSNDKLSTMTFSMPRELKKKLFEERKPKE